MACERIQLRLREPRRSPEDPRPDTRVRKSAGPGHQVRPPDSRGSALGRDRGLACVEATFANGRDCTIQSPLSVSRTHSTSWGVLKCCSRRTRPIQPKFRVRRRKGWVRPARPAGGAGRRFRPSSATISSSLWTMVRSRTGWGSEDGTRERSRRDAAAGDLQAQAARSRNPQDAALRVGGVACVHHARSPGRHDREKQRRHGAIHFAYSHRQPVEQRPLAEAACDHPLIRVQRLVRRHVQNAEELAGKRLRASFAHGAGADRQRPRF